MRTGHIIYNPNNYKFGNYLFFMKFKRLFIFILIIILLGLLAYYYPYIQSAVSGNSISQTNTNYQKEPALVTRIVDGDTIHVNINGTDETIRLLGINTPEKNKPYYQEAKDFLKKEIENKSIEILRDTEDTDRYDRKLRYIFYNNQLINVEIVQEGLATTFMLEGLKYKDKLINAEKFARNNEIALWKKSQDSCASCIILIKLEPIDDYFIIKNNCNNICNLTSWFVKDDANHFTHLNTMNSGEEKEYKSKTEIWNDDHDRFFMRDEKGDLVIFYEY